MVDEARSLLGSPQVPGCCSVLVPLFSAHSVARSWGSSLMHWPPRAAGPVLPGAQSRSAWPRVTADRVPGCGAWCRLPRWGRRSSHPRLPLGSAELPSRDFAWHLPSLGSPSLPGFNWRWLLLSPLSCHTHVTPCLRSASWGPDWKHHRQLPGPTLGILGLNPPCRPVPPIAAHVPVPRVKSAEVRDRCTC